MLTIPRNNLAKLAVALCSAMAVCLAASTQAAPLALVDTPLFLTTGVKPNLIMAIDDSGSMDFELLLRGNDGAAWWRTANASGNCTAATGNSFTGCIADGTTDQPAAGKVNFNNGGASSTTWKKYAYLFPNGSGGNTSDQRRLNDATNDHFAIPPLPDHGWSRSPEHNSAYFDPTTTYNPWQNGGGFTFTNASPTAARFDPVFTGAGTIDLTRNFAGTAGVDASATCGDATMPAVGANFYFRVYTGMTLPEGTCFHPSSTVSSALRHWQVVSASGCTVGGTCDTTIDATPQTYTLPTNTSVAIGYFPATFYLSAANAPPASYGYTATPTPDGKAPDGSTLNRYEIKPANFATTAQYNAAIGNFANWFSYYRKRHQALRAGLGTAFNTLGDMRVAGFTINQASSATSPDVTMGDIDVGANRTALYTNFYQNWVASGGTPNRPAVANIVRNFKRTGSGAPITYSCQRNFGMLFTDGFSNPPATGDGFYTVGNVDGSKGAPYADTVSNTMADGIMGAYANSLRTDLTQGKVTVPSACSNASPDPRLDCNTNPHMNFYAITLGTRGLQFDPDNPVDPYVTQPLWPTTFPARHPSAVDDLWHAAINGHGELLNAASSVELADKLGSVLRSIVETTTSASSASVNSGSISSSSRVYQAKFNSTNWTGQLLSYRVDPTNGSLDTTPLWDAGAVGTLPAADSRNIITINSDGAKVPFRWPGSGTGIDATRQHQLDDATASPWDATLEENRLNYLRGDGSNESATDATKFRARATKLGDIIDSAPVFVGEPVFNYSDALESKPYSTFRTANKTRTPTVYAGANDGMLHAFNADTGEEILGFIPGAVFGNLKLLSSRSYSGNHRFFVDGSPNMSDVFFNNDWHTVLAGGLNKGGRGIYALDITDPAEFTEANANSLILWEFTDTKAAPYGDADLGYTYSQPAIVRLHNGKWGAVFGNGYNNAGTGQAVLYVVDIETGALIKKISTLKGSAATPNGLSTPAVVDLNGDSLADFVFAGDLQGNLWKFDIRNSNPSQWGISYDDLSGDPAPLFTAVDASSNPQPITDRPEIGRGPNGAGMIVLFGTGKFLESSDRTVVTNGPRQSFYGVIDTNSGTSSMDVVSGRSVLQQQTILFEQEVTFGSQTVNVRVPSDNPRGSKGWYLDLVSPTLGYQGERVVSNPILRNGRIIFTTLIPDSDPCGFGGTSWLMELDALSGGRLTTTPFDLNRDGKFDGGDLVEVTLADGTKVVLPVGGIQSTVGITPEPGILASPTAEYKYSPGTSGNISVTVENPGVNSYGRQSWRQTR